jgi:hypothetical protein
LVDKSDPIVQSPLASIQENRYVVAPSAEPEVGFTTQKQIIQGYSHEEVGLVQNVLVSEAKSTKLGHASSSRSRIFATVNIA